MNELTIIKRGEAAYIDSREVAAAIEKRHDNLLRDIGKYREILAHGGLLKIEESDFFVESSYLNAQNKPMPCYLISKRGAEVIANKLTGEKGVLFTFAYVSKFNEMEQREREAEIKAHARPRLSEFNSAVKNVLSGMSYCNATPNRVMNFLHGVYEPLGIAVSENGSDRDYFSVTVIAQALGIYSDTGRPHGHAVSAIIAKIGDLAHHTIAIPYGLVGVTFKYDYSVAERVENWIAVNGKPHLIPHLDFDYHVYYRCSNSFEYEQLSLFDDYNDDDVKITFFSADELDAMCADYDDCDECPGRHVCGDTN